MRSWSSYIQQQYALLFLILLTFVFSVAPHAAAGTTMPAINFPNGLSGSSSTVKLNGGAQLNGSALQLTGATSGMASSAWYVTPVNIQSFTTNFTFQLTNATADGFTFAIQNNGDSVTGGSGGQLGYAGISNSIAVKFDLYNNDGEGPNSTGLYTNGASPMLPAIDLTSSGINLHSGDTMAVQLVYNGATLTMTITDTATKASFSTNWTINIPATIGADTAYVGFTGGTGAFTANQQILTWTYVPVLPAPVFSVASGSYASAQKVTVSDTTSGATIYYTTNGSAPTTSSAVYSGPITVSSNETLEAMAVETGYTNSPTATAAYVINPNAAPVINFPSGFASSQDQLTLLGSTQLTGSSVQLTGASGAEAGAAWFATPVNVQSFATDFSFQLTSASADGFTFAIHNNSDSSSGSPGGGLGYQGIPSSVAVKFDLYNNAGEGTDSTGLYTDGASPTVPAIDMTSSGVNLHSGDTMAVHLVYNGTTLTMTITDTVTKASFSTSWTINIPATLGADTAYVGFTGGTGGETAIQKVLTWIYTSASGSSPILSAPAFSVAAGTYTSAQTVSISDATSGATIYYTTNGTTPTTSSTKYSGAITVSSTETLEAIAVASGYTNSPVATAAYTIGSALPTPSFSVAAGTYSSTQAVAISDATSGPTIYYTTNGTTPTTSSNVYSGPITVSSSETLKAVAAMTGYTNSPVAAAAYTIDTSSSTTPIINYPNGFPSGCDATNLWLENNAKCDSPSVHLVPSSPAHTTGNLTYQTPVNVSTFTTTFTFHISCAAAQIYSTYSATIPRCGAGFGFMGVSDPNYMNPYNSHFNADSDQFSWSFCHLEVTPVVCPVPGEAANVEFLVKFDMYDYSTSIGEQNLTGYYYSWNSPTGYVGQYPNNANGSASNQVNPVPSTSMGPAGSPATGVNPATGIDLASGDEFSATIVNNGSTISLSLTDLKTGYNYKQSWPTNPSIGTLIQNGNGPVAYVGFGGGTATFLDDVYIDSWTYSTGASTTPPSTPTAATPTFSVAAGTYTSAQTVSISDATSGATIYYTTNGTTPTTSSTKYSGAITVASTETLKAVAVASGYTSSAAATATYTISSALPTPTFSVPGGTYGSPQTVTISDGTSGPTIYYTTNGSTPTTSSTKYSGAISVSSSETLEAIAVESGYTNSPVAAAAYTIDTSSSTTPIINYPNGFPSGCDATNLWLENNAKCDSPSVHLVPSSPAHTTGNLTYQTPVNVSTFTTTFTFHISCAAAQIYSTYSATIPRCGAGFGFMGVSDPNYMNPYNSHFNADSDQFSWSFCHLEVTPVVCPVPGEAANVEFLVKFDMYDYSTSIGEQNLTGYYYSWNSPTGYVGQYPNNANGSASNQVNPVPSTSMGPAGSPATGVNPATGIDLASGDEFSATIVNNGSTISLSLTDLKTGYNYKQSWPTNPSIGTLIQNGNGPVAYVGFGGGTATFLDDVYIDSWTYSTGASTTP